MLVREYLKSKTFSSTHGLSIMYTYTPSNGASPEIVLFSTCGFSSSEQSNYFQVKGYVIHFPSRRNYENNELRLRV